MTGKRRVRAPRGRLAVVLVALVALLGLTAVGVASAQSGGSNPQPGTTTARTNPVPGLNQGESARFWVTDTGRSVVIVGRATGMTRGSYVSLIYADAACSQAESPTGDTLDGSWQNHGDGSQSLFAVYDGADYRAVRGHIGSVSVRKITAAANTGSGNFTLTAQARACAKLKPVR